MRANSAQLRYLKIDHFLTRLNEISAAQFKMSLCFSTDHQQRGPDAGAGCAADPSPVGGVPLAAGGGRRQAHHAARQEGRLGMPLAPRLGRQQCHEGNKCCLYPFLIIAHLKYRCPRLQ